MYENCLKHHLSLLLLRISGFTSSICGIDFFIFLIHIFWIHGHPPHIRKCAIMWVFYRVPDNSISWNCVKISIVSLRYSRKIFFPGMTDCLQRNLAKVWAHIGLERASKLKKCHGWSFLAVQDSAISDIVGRSVCRSEPTNNQSLGSIKEWP